MVKTKSQNVLRANFSVSTSYRGKTGKVCPPPILNRIKRVKRIITDTFCTGRCKFDNYKLVRNIAFAITRKSIPKVFLAKYYAFLVNN